MSNENLHIQPDNSSVSHDNSTVPRTGLQAERERFNRLFHAIMDDIIVVYPGQRFAVSGDITPIESPIGNLQTETSESHTNRIDNSESTR